MRKPHRKQLLAWLLTAVLLLTNFPISVLSEEIAENPIQAEATEQDEQGIAEEPNLSDFPTEEPDEPIEPPVSQKTNETPEPSEPSGTMEIPADENTPDIPDQDKSETPEPSDSDIEETPSPEVPEETPDTDSTDEPPVEETPIPEESPLPDDEEAFSVSEAILEYGYAYAAAYAESVIYEDAALTAPLFTLKEDGGVLLITEETETAFKVWWLTYADEPLSGYIAKSDIADISISEETRQTLKEQRPCGFITSDIGYMDAFVLLGELTISEEAPEATPAPEPQAPFLQTGDYAAATTETRVYLSIDETMTEDDNGDDWQGVFTRDAVVYVESVQKDAFGRDWCEVRYLFGADDADGKLIWTDTDTLFVPMDDLSPTDAHELTVTDYAYPFEPIALYASADFNLRNHNASVKTFYPGQQGLQGSSGHDSEYKQIAKLDGYGTIYATPHYLEGQTVYCLEHTMNSPGAKDNPTGPFEVVDLDGYAIKPGYSGDIYSSRTMHAIGWVIRHTYPYMIVDTGYEDSDVWSRVAGQFAIREVVKQLEGDWYVRDYWRMDEFYRASGQAPADYLEYARWLASCAIRRSGITGDIGIGNKSMTMQGGSYVGTVTLTTDADLIRISRSVGSLTGNSGGSDGEYYYLRSGDTISVTSTQSTFAITAESVSSQDEEAAFLVGIPDADIQKVVIPQHGLPAKFKAVRIEFEQPYGAIVITKTSASSGAALSGAVFELLNSAGAVLQSQTTGADGSATFSNVQAGTYTVREKNAPQGYQVSIQSSQTVTVTAGATSRLSFANAPIQGKIRIVKTDSLTHEPLAGVQFIITRLSAPPSANGAGVGETILLTTNEQGAVETGWLDYGRYRIEETAVPAHYVDAPFRTEIDCFEGGKTYEIAAANEPTKGWLRLTKTDRKNGNPVAGVTFDIYENDAYGNALVGSMTTDENGVAVSEPLRKGRYLVREHGETAGYVFEGITLDATVKSDETTDLSATNQPVMTRIRIKKRDKDEYAQTDAPSVRGDGELTGATFRVLAGADILDRQRNVIWLRGATVIDAIQTSGEDAAATTDELWPGLYEIVEIAPPVGYQPSDERMLVDTASAAAQSREAVVTYDALKLNEIKLGAQAIVKVLGDNKTDNQHTETPEEGAEFHVYLRKAGSYENAREFERDHLITDKSGYAKTKLLPYGVYVLEQTVGKDGFEIKKPLLFEITGEENPIQPPILTLNDRPILYRLRLIKTDARTGKTVTLAGASFKLKDADSNTVTQTIYYPKKQTLDTFTTDESGCVTLPEEVGWGLYTIEEIASPKGYLIRTESLPVFVGKTGDTADQVYELDIEIPNEAVMGQIRLEKKGLQLVGFETQTEMGFEYQSPVFEERCLAGAVFEVRAAEEIVCGDGTVWYQKDELVDTITTSGTGTDWSKELPLGKYKLMEIAAPEGYALSDEVYEVELKSIDGHTPLVTVTAKAHNEYLSAEIHLEKEKEILKPYTDENGYIRQGLTTTYGLGFVFGLYNADDIHYADGMLPADTLIAVGMTDMHGKLTFSGNLPHGAYTIRELDGPKGWKLNPNRFDVRISTENQADDAPVIRVSLDGTVRNELIYTKVTLTKTDITGAETVPGAEIEVKNEQGEVIYRAVTDENGEIPDIPVTPGCYTFKEVLAPEGYALNETTCSFTVDEDGHVSGDTVLRDDFTRFTLKKVGEHNEPLAGVAFSLIDAQNGTVSAHAVSDEKGEFEITGFTVGDWILREDEAPEGFNLMNDYPFHVGYNRKNDQTVTLVNIPNHYEFEKTDHRRKPLSGVRFGLYDDKGMFIRELVSDENGIVCADNLVPGSYLIRETRPLDGYAGTDEEITFTIDESYIPPQKLVRITNTPVIQTGVDFPITPTMVFGLLMMAASVLLGLMRLLKKKHR